MQYSADHRAQIIRMNPLQKDDRVELTGAQESVSGRYAVSLEGSDDNLLPFIFSIKTSTHL